MTIENDLNRIANALEAIAGNLDRTFSVLSSENQTLTAKTEPTKRTRSKKTETQPEPQPETQADRVRSTRTPDTTIELSSATEDLNKDTIEKLASGDLDPQPPVTQATIADEFGVTESAEPEIKYADLNRKFFTLLTNVRDHKSADEARALALKFLEKFNNGKPISEAGLPKENYKPFNDKLDELLAKYPKLDKQEG